MALKIHGIPQNRTYRALWMAEELGIPYERIPPGPDLAKINPNAKMPVIEDDGITLFESMAINIYLAKKHDKGLAPKNLAEEAHVLQWSFWVMTEVEKPLLNALFYTAGIAGYPKDPEQVAKHVAELQKPLGVLNAHLANRQHLVGDRFTVADLNVASVLNWSKMARLDLSAFPQVAEWLNRCLGRPAAQKARG